jgi:hypothetical protein
MCDIMGQITLQTFSLEENELLIIKSVLPESSHAHNLIHHNFSIFMHKFDLLDVKSFR